MAKASLCDEAKLAELAAEAVDAEYQFGSVVGLLVNEIYQLKQRLYDLEVELFNRGVIGES